LFAGVCSSHLKQAIVLADGVYGALTTWLQAKGSYLLPGGVLDVAQVALQVNLAKEERRLTRPTSKELQALVG
ncbi:hypothetical protein LZM73_22990, partial [Pseudomonas aeruginosa]|nr:hypothetical protein [Pseudomonas aeruginosa]